MKKRHFIEIFLLGFIGILWTLEAQQLGINDTGFVEGAAGFTGLIEVDIDTTGTAIDWDMIDNNASAISWDAAGKSGIIDVVTTNSSEGVTMSGTLGVTGVTTATGGLTMGGDIDMATNNLIEGGTWSLTLGKFRGGVTFEGVATDVTTGTNETFRVAPNGTGEIEFESLVNIGTTPYTPGHSPASLYAEGVVEFDGTAHFDGNVRAYNGVNLYNGGNVNAALAISSDDGLLIAAHPTDGRANRNIILTDYAYVAKDHDHDSPSESTTLFFQGLVNPDTNNTIYGYIRHTGGLSPLDGGSLVLVSNSGNIELSPADDEVLPDADNAIDLGRPAGTGLGPALEFKNIYVDGTCFCDAIDANGSTGITDNTSFWMCTAADCSTKCQVTIVAGVIISCT